VISTHFVDGHASWIALISVAEDQVVSLALQALDRGLGAGRGGDVVALSREQLGEGLQERRVVVHHQHAGRRLSGGASPRRVELVIVEGTVGVVIAVPVHHEAVVIARAEPACRNGTRP
jgi:hypothetical protein